MVSVSGRCRTRKILTERSSFTQANLAAALSKQSAFVSSNGDYTNSSTRQKFQPSRVTITANDGKSYSTRVDVPKGDPRDPMTEEEIAVKFNALGSDVIGKNQCEKLRNCIVNLENVVKLDELLERMREGFRWVRGSRITAPDAAVQVETPRAIWIGKINVYSSDDGVMQLLDERVNRLPTPFKLEWYRFSGKPWDWKLVRVSNASFEIPADLY